jgi:S1-C subfamily serine protease
MKKMGVAAMVSLMGLGVASAQFEDVRPQDRPRLEAQALGVFEAVSPVLARAAASTVEVRVWRKRVGFGTVVGPEQVLTKWSDVSKAVESLSCRGSDGRLLAAKVVGVYQADDLALLEVKGLKSPPINFDDAAEPPLGSFLALARPDGSAGGMGVVSVLPRSLRESDRAFLGVIMDTTHAGPGVKIERVQPETGAERAGLRRGDIVLGLDGKETNGTFELGAMLQRMEPGGTIKLRFRRGEVETEVEVELGGRPDAAKIPANRMEAMNRMGGHRYSRVVEDFGRVMQTDMQIEPEDCGAPVVDLDGKVVGVALARAGRIKTFILPTADIKALLEGEAAEPDPAGLALRWDDGKPEDFERAEVKQGDPMERMKRHMEDMEHLLEELDRGTR